MKAKFGHTSGGAPFGENSRDRVSGVSVKGESASQDLSVILHG